MHKKELLNYIGDALKKPAASNAEIAERIREDHGRYCTTAMVCQGLHQLRKADPKTFGWTVLYVKKGPSEAGRYFRVRVDANGNVLSDEKVDHYIDGAISITRNMKTEAEGTARQAKVVMAQLPTPALKRMARSTARACEFAAQQLEDLNEALAEERQKRA